MLRIPDEAMLETLLPKIVDISIKAGEAIMQVYADPANVVTEKEDKSPLTQADLASDKVIADGIEKLALGWPVLSEESAQTPYDKRSSWQRFWLVDPLDGTREFVKRNGEFTVNIALVENGVPVLGVVYAPVLNVCYFAARGAGAFVRRNGQDGQRISVKTHRSGEPLLVVASRSHSDARTEEMLKKLGDVQCISMGSSLKFCLVAEGAAHFYPRLGPTMEWDTAAAHAIVNQAGGKVYDRGGRELVYNKEDLHNPEFFVLSAEDDSLFKRISS
jgi:3'(2'), 5'-bisphosphate nucleotidase